MSGYYVVMVQGPLDGTGRCTAWYRTAACGWAYSLEQGFLFADRDHAEAVRDAASVRGEEPVAVVPFDGGRLLCSEAFDHSMSVNKGRG